MLRLTLVLLLALSGCVQSQGQQSQKSLGELNLATTTSVYDSGLLQALIPPFEERCACRVKVVALGTGAALRRAELGGADAVLVHAPEAELKFVADGHGINRRAVMHNDFVIIGPANDPAGIRGEKDAAIALRKISESSSLFFSRGDDSGTHKKEQELWARAGVEPSGSWYRRTGVGMGSTIVIADQARGYTLTDRSTYLSMKVVGLVVLSEGDPSLINPYSVIAVNPAKQPGVNYELAMLFIGYITSPAGQRMIADFGKQQGVEGLFHPDAIPEEVLGNE